MARRFVKKKTVVLEGDDSEPWDPSDIGDVSVDFLIEAALREGRFVYDLETTSLNPRRGKIEGVAFYVPNEKYPDFAPVRAWFPFVDGTVNQTIGAELKPLRPAMPREATMNALRKLWSIPELIAIAHNGVFDMGWLKLASGTEEPIEVANQIADSMLADYMQDETLFQYGLKQRVKKLFNHQMTTYAEASGKQGVFAFALKKPLGVYAMDDCMWTYRLWKWAMESMRRQDKPKQHKNDDWKSPLDPTAMPGYYSKLERLYWKMEMKIQRIILEMETQGCLIDWEWLVEVQRKLERDKYKILEEIRNSAGWIPNLRSPKQVSDFLYLPKEQGGLGLPTDGLDYNEDLDTYTTRDKVISHFGKKIPVVKMLLDYRSFEVIDRSFCQKLIALAQEEGRCYSHFKQTGTKIGRLSSADPINLMNQPRDKNLVRKAFCSHRPNETDHERRKMRFLDADYGQVELRMAAHLAVETGMIEVYSGGSICKKGENGVGCKTFLQFHGCKDVKKIKCKWTGDLAPDQAKVCGKCGGEVEWLMRCRHVDLHQRTSEDVGVDRNPLAKNLNFGLLYRMGAPKFCTYADLYDEATGEPRIEFAEDLIKKWHAAYPGIAGWHQEVIEKLIDDGFIAYTILRRRRRLREEWSRAEFRAGTQAIQFMVSGSCQDIIKAAMIRVFEARNKKIETTLPAESRLWEKFRFMIQVHDELVFEVHQDIEKEAVELVRTNMEAIGPMWNLRVPLVASVKVGRNWDETH